MITVRVTRYDLLKMLNTSHNFGYVRYQELPQDAKLATQFQTQICYQSILSIIQEVYLVWANREIHPQDPKTDTK